MTTTSHDDDDDSFENDSGSSSTRNSIRNSKCRYESKGIRLRLRGRVRYKSTRVPLIRDKRGRIIIINLKPSTLNPQPSTLNPKP